MIHNRGMSTKTPRLRGRSAVEARLRFLKSNPLCSQCLKRGHISIAEEVDHIKPLFKGGADTDDNKQSLCKPCHKLKTARDMGHRNKRTTGPVTVLIGSR